MTADTQSNGTSRRTFAGMVAGLVGLQFIAAWPVNILPMVNGALIDHRAFSASLAGGVASVELLCFSAALIGLGKLARRFRCRTIGLAGLALSIACNLLTAIGHDPIVMFPLRAGAGFATGLAALAATTAIAGMPQVERLTTTLSVTTASLVAIGVLAAGYVIEADGADGLFLFLALIPLLAAGSALALPADLKPSVRMSRPIGGGLLQGPTAASIISLFGTAVVWAFAERIGVHIGLRVGTVGAMIALLSLTGIVGGIAAVACGRFRRERAWAIVGIALLGVSSAAMPLAADSISYGVAIGGQAFFFVFVGPFLLALACHQDPSGVVAARMLGLTSLAAAFAPSLAGALLEVGRIDYLTIAPLLCTPLALYALRCDAPAPHGEQSSRALALSDPA